MRFGQSGSSRAGVWDVVRHRGLIIPGLSPKGIQRGLSEFGYCFNLLVGGVIRSEFKQSDRSVLIGFSNRVRGAKRLATPKALGDSDNHMSCHGRKYGTGRTRFQLQSANA
jgi:hypothetical protein